MVVALAVVLEEANVFFGIDGGIDDILREKFAAGVVGAAESREDAAFIEEFEGAEVDFFVSAHRVHERFFVSGETGGIEDDEVVGFLGVFEEVEHVGLDDLDAEAIFLGIEAGGFAGTRGNVDGGDLSGARFGAGEGETALVGEAVEDAFAFGVFRDFVMCLELIEIKACFLSVGEIDGEGEAVGFDLKDAGIGAVEVGDFGFEALGFAHGGIVAQQNRLRGKLLDDGLDNELFAHVHGEGKCLEDKVIAVSVEDYAGESVGFTPHDAAKSGIDVGFLANEEGLGDAA